MRKLYVLFLSLFLVTAAAPAHAADRRNVPTSAATLQRSSRL